MQNSLTRSNPAARVIDIMAALVSNFRTDSNYEEVRPARWRDKTSNTHFETGYSYGEGRLRVYPGGQRKPARDLSILGVQPGEVDTISELLLIR
jgi:hypothetical protein